MPQSMSLSPTHMRTTLRICVEPSTSHAHTLTRSQPTLTTKPHTNSRYTHASTPPQRHLMFLAFLALLVHTTLTTHTLHTLTDTHKHTLCTHMHNYTSLIHESFCLIVPSSQ
ncbi:hypothetical protein PIB30_109126, partial [Stylosanthes scabra]|nr:hypothetical protein [Stylosanthes scabra]